MNNQGRQCQAEGNRGEASIVGNRWIAGVSIMAGAAIGATVMYFCDPHRGKARRVELKQKATSAARHTYRELAKEAEDLLNRAKGLVAKADAEVREGVADDDVIEQRVRSHMGHITEHVSDIQTEVVDGVVALRGTVAPDKHRRLVSEILVIPGVKGIRDLLAFSGSV